MLLITFELLFGLEDTCILYHYGDANKEEIVIEMIGEQGQKEKRGARIRTSGAKMQTL